MYTLLTVTLQQHSDNSPKILQNHSPKCSLIWPTQSMCSCGKGLDISKIVYKQHVTWAFSKISIYFHKIRREKLEGWSPNSFTCILFDSRRKVFQNEKFCSRNPTHSLQCLHSALVLCRVFTVGLINTIGVCFPGYFITLSSIHFPASFSITQQSSLYSPSHFCPSQLHGTYPFSLSVSPSVLAITDKILEKSFVKLHQLGLQ